MTMRLITRKMMVPRRIVRDVLKDIITGEWRIGSWDGGMSDRRGTPED
jgi:hypothetical protein